MKSTTTPAEREPELRRLFEEARRKNPRWHAYTLLSLRVWPKRPPGTTAYECARIARDYEKRWDPGEGATGARVPHLRRSEPSRK
jgi:hypothetical protein